jgi:hypothetical protein
MRVQRHSQSARDLRARSPIGPPWTPHRPAAGRSRRTGSRSRCCSPYSPSQGRPSATAPAPCSRRPPSPGPGGPTWSASHGWPATRATWAASSWWSPASSCRWWPSGCCRCSRCRPGAPPASASPPRWPHWSSRSDCGAPRCSPSAVSRSVSSP